MSSRRGTSGLSGILLVDKPAGMTSHDVVDRVRRLSGERRVGHAGTLDPSATGLLVVLIGPATRLAPYLTSADKHYLADICFGSATDTDDSDGAVIRSAPVPDRFGDATYAEGLLDGLLGESLQRPPAYSAIKVEGKTAHRAARAGEDLELEPRPIVVHSAQLVAIDEAESIWRVRFLVSKGTYIRSLARDLGERAGSAAHLSGLRREESGGLSVNDAHKLEAIAASEGCPITELFLDPRKAFAHLPSLEAAEKDVAAGRAITDPSGELGQAALVAVYVEGGRLGAIYAGAGNRLVPRVVMAVPVAGPDSRASL